MGAAAVLASLWQEAALPGAALEHVTLSGAEPVLPSHFAVGTAAQAAIAAAALAAAEFHHARGGARQEVRRGHAPRRRRVPLRAAAACERRGARRAGRDRRPLPHRRWLGAAARQLPPPPRRHPPPARLRARAATRSPTRCDAREALAFEAEATAAGLCVAALRSFAEWDAHPQGQAVPTRPLLAIERIGEAPARPLPAADRPLAGVRVIELTRVIAGPVCGRTLAAHGAEVLRITAPHLPTFAQLDIDTGRGKRAARLDLRREADRRALRDLVRGADVFIQGYRPGAIAAFGFGPEALARLRPGIVAVSLSAYGAAGPWAEKRGFDSLVQTASGFNAAEAEAAREETPRALPAQALDFATGHLLAFGAIAGLIRRAEQGGSWHVQASLARTGHWLRGLGRVADGFATPDPTADDFADLMEETDTPFGRVRAVRHPAILSATPAYFATSPVPPTDTPAWQSAPDPRQARLARALRDNLARRKQQARARRAPDG